MDMSKKYSLQVFEGETKISTSSFPENFTVETVRFSPLPHDESVVFYFEARHAKICQPQPSAMPLFGFDPATTQVPKYEFLLKLILLSATKRISSFDNFSINVKIFYSDGSLFKKYTPLSNIKISQMDPIVFQTVTNLTIQAPAPNIFLPASNYCAKMRSGPLTLMCKMFFRNDSSTSPLVPSNYNLKSVYESGMFNDFNINVGDKTFPVHKVILIAHSPYFTKMLTQDWLESKENSVTITDSTPEIVDLFLRYLYTGEINDKSWPSVKDLYGMANRYEVEILRKDCIDIFISLMNVDIICEILMVAYTSDDLDLKTITKNFAVNHIKEIMYRDDWKHLVAMQPIIGYEVMVNFAPT